MIKTNVIRLLESAGIAPNIRTAGTGDEFTDAVRMAVNIGVEPERLFKTLVAETPEHEYFVFVIPAPATLHLKKAARAAGVKKIDLIPQKQLLPLTGYVHGGCSPIGMKKQFPTFLDETAILYDEIVVSGGRIGLSVGMAPETLAGYLAAEFADLTG